MTTSEVQYFRPLAHSFMRHHRSSVRAVHLAIILIAGVLTFLLRFGLGLPQFRRQELMVALCVWVLVKTPVFYLMRIDHGWWPSTSAWDLLHLAAGNVIASTLTSLILLLVATAGSLRSVYVLDFVLCFMMMAGARIAVRVIYESFRRQPVPVALRPRILT